MASFFQCCGNFHLVFLFAPSTDFRSLCRIVLYKEIFVFGGEGEQFGHSFAPRIGAKLAKKRLPPYVEVVSYFGC